MSDPVIIIGAGPAGLTAAHELTAQGVPVVLIEKTERVGGIARTDVYKGYRFDIGGHRFFTRVPWVMDFWKKIMDDDFLRRPRESRIFYRGQFYSYPIKPFEVLHKLGFKEAALAIISFAWSQIFKRPQEENFEDYIINHYGERLYHHFFKSYTEKVWGMPCTEIRAEWAAQRIKGMSMWDMFKAAVLPQRNKFTSLIDQFYYPRLGPGQMWEKVLAKVEATGLAKIYFNSEPIKLQQADGKINSVEIKTLDGMINLNCRAVISSMPLKELLNIFDPALAESKRAAANKLHYRDFLTIALIIKQPHMFTDNWIYIHDPSVRVGRIQNFKNWSPEMVPDENMSCLGLEYFVFETDDLWKMADADLVKLGAEELARIGLAHREDIVDGTVVRMPKAYPVYDRDYEEAMPVIRAALADFKNLYPIGRNGMHKYNNQDHAMWTAKLSVENIFGAQHDVWEVNVERVYHEEVEKEKSGAVK